jgi:hypothetical protein
LTALIKTTRSAGILSQQFQSRLLELIAISPIVSGKWLGENQTMTGQMPTLPERPGVEGR